MDFLLLGPLDVVRDGGLALRGAKQRALLALLLLRANEVVSRDTLLDELWSDPGAGHGLDVQISRLRKALRPDEPLVTRGGGYVLEVDPESIDVRRFERLLADARAADDPARASELLREALALWRGPALADAAYGPVAQREAERLEELRLVALEERFDAELALGRQRALVSEIEAAASAHPWRERLREQLMLALYRSGRQADALRVYAETRRRLVEELGIEPGPRLRALEQAILRHDPSLAAPQPRAEQRRRRGLVAAGAVALTAVAAAAVLLVSGGGTQSSSAQPSAHPDSLAVLDAHTGRVVGQAAVRDVALTRFGFGSLWSASFDGELTRVDPGTGAVVASLGTGVEHPSGLAVGAGSVWIADCCSPTLVRVDPAVNVVADRFRLPTTFPYLATQTGEVVVGARSVWVSQGFANPSYVVRLDPATGRVRHAIRIPEGGAQALAFGDGAVWVAGPALGYVTRIDAATNRITATEQALHSWMCCLAAGGGYAWAAISPDHAVWKIGEDGRVLTSIELPPTDVQSLVYADGAVWAADGEAGTVVRIDPTTNRTRAYHVGHHVSSVSVRDGRIAVGVQTSARDVTAHLSGAVVHVALKADTLDSTDPLAVQDAFNPQQVAFHYATCAKLYNYPDSEGAAGEQLVPEVAAGPPTVRDGGRTYVFRLRHDYAFSPPSNERVTAESFRHEIERVLSPRVPGPWNLALLADVVGAAAYHSGKAAHVAGVVASGDTLTIRLVAPHGDLLERLALPKLCPVPVDTPVVPGGIDASIPSAGPYYLAARGGNVVVLEPNPNYRGPRPHRLDAIVLRWNVDAGDATAGLGRGAVDYVSEVDPALAPHTSAVLGAGRRFSATPTNWTELLALNSARPLFADPRVRRTVAAALDRRALASKLGFGPNVAATPHILSPNMAGSRGPEPAPVAARLHGPRTAVLATYADADGKAYDAPFARALRAQLRHVGIELRVRLIRQTDTPAAAAAELARADIARVERNASDTVDAVDYLESLPYLPRTARAALVRLDPVQQPRRGLAAAALAHRLERAALYIGLAYTTRPELVSKRLGCLVHQPEVPGLDLAALCVR